MKDRPCLGQQLHITLVVRKFVCRRAECPRKVFCERLPGLADPFAAYSRPANTPNVQKRLGCSHASLGSLSESVTVFDPDRLKEIIADLGTQLAPVGRDARLKDIAQTFENLCSGID